MFYLFCCFLCPHILSSLNLSITVMKMDHQTKSPLISQTARSPKLFRFRNAHPKPGQQPQSESRIDKNNLSIDISVLIGVWRDRAGYWGALLYHAPSKFARTRKGRLGSAPYGALYHWLLWFKTGDSDGNTTSPVDFQYLNSFSY